MTAQGVPSYVLDSARTGHVRIGSVGAALLAAAQKVGKP